MKQFDLEAARNGAPFRYVRGAVFGKLRFVGTHSDGNIVCETEDGFLRQYSPGVLCMIPQKKTYYLNVYRKFGGVSVGIPRESEESAKELADSALEIIKIISFEVEE